MDTGVVGQGYTVADLDLARQRFGTAHVELDPCGNLVVTPASDPHEYAINQLRRLVERALEVAGLDAVAYLNGPPWRVPGGSGYTNQPDLVVLTKGTRRAGVDGLHFAPAPLLVAEVASPSTRAVDRSRKRDDYLLGGAGAYWMLDLPGLTPVDEPSLTVALRHRGGSEQEVGPFTGSADLAVPFPVTVDLETLRWTGRWA